MACGTRFYMLATLATSMLSAVMMMMYKLDLFDRRVVERILRVRLPAGIAPDGKLESIFADLLSDHRLISVESVAGGTLEEHVYSVALKDEANSSRLLEAVRGVNGNNKVMLVIGQHEVDL